MTCNEAAEFVSALCDGLTIPRAAAEHLDGCKACQAQLTEYLLMGAELRRVASLELQEEPTVYVWTRRQGPLTNWWQKGWERMRIPRMAFAALIGGVVVLGCSLAVVGVRARSAGSVVLLKIAPVKGQSTVCPLSTEDKKWNSCASIGAAKDGVLTYQFEFLSRDGDRVTLGVRAQFTPGLAGTHSFSLASLPTLPQKRYSFEPGDPLQVDVPGLGAMEVTGEWTDHVPALLNQPNHQLDPGPGEIRIDSPVLLRGKQVVGDLEGGSTTANQPGQRVVIYMPGEGLFTLSLSPSSGAIEGYVRLNRTSFEINGESYSIVTGTPIARGDKIWVVHDARFKPEGMSNETAFITSVDANVTFPSGPRNN